MTIHHAIVICFAMAVVAFCGSHTACHDMMPQLATLAGTAIGVAGGNAMAAIRAGTHEKKPKGDGGGTK